VGWAAADRMVPITARRAPAHFAEFQAAAERIRASLSERSWGTEPESVIMDLVLLRYLAPDDAGTKPWSTPHVAVLVAMASKRAYRWDAHGHGASDRGEGSVRAHPHDAVVRAHQCSPPRPLDPSGVRGLADTVPGHMRKTDARRLLVVIAPMSLFLLEAWPAHRRAAGMPTRWLPSCSRSPSFSCRQAGWRSGPAAGPALGTR
jgi:hypothetical protein